MTRRARLLLVDDSAFVRRAAERMLAPLRDVSIAGTAGTGEEAVRQVHLLRPDLVIMDVNMPGMGGLAALERIMAECPTPVLLMSSLTREGAEITLRALEAGAVDFVDKTGAASTMDLHTLGPVLREKVTGILSAQDPLPAPVRAIASTPPPAPESRPSPYEVVAVGTSTGGPRALVKLIPALPAHLGAAVLVAQHMPAGFTETLAERLNRRSALQVSEAEDGDHAAPGRVLIAPGGRQMALYRANDGLRVRIWDDPTQLYRPAVNLLLQSVAKVVGAHAVGVVLTGMGDDGADGLARIQAAGGRTLVESTRTAVIDGMPAAARPFAEQSLDLDQIASALADLCGGAG